MIELGPLVLLRPWWLLGLLAVPLLWRWWQAPGVAGGDWERVIAARLQPLLLGGQAQGGRRGVRILLASLLTLALLAAAGPAWDRQPLPLARGGQATVAVFDLSPSMSAPDLRPDRLTRARYKLIDWLDRQQDGQVGLVVFGGQAFAVAPLTSDARTLRHLAEVLDPALMPVAGARADLGLRKAVELLDGAGAAGGEILLISDGVNRRAEALLPQLRAQGIRVSVLAVGTAAGAPVPQPDGGFLTDRRGDIVLPRLDQARLARFASAGGGRYASLSVDDADLRQLASTAVEQAQSERLEETERQSDYWRDRGPWLLLPCLLAAALLFRRGWLLSLLLAGSVVGGMQPGPAAAQAAGEPANRPEATAPAPAAAWRWQDLWLRRDQQAAQALANDDAALAESLSTDPAWAGAAAAAAGQHQRAAEHFGQGSDATAHYNQGTALAQAGQYEAAIEALQQALQADPEHADARANLQAIEDWLRNQQQPSSAPEQGDSSDSQQPDQQDSQGQDGQPQQQDSQGQDGQPQQDAQSQDGQQQGQQDSAPSGAESDASQEQAGGKPEGDGPEPEAGAAEQADEAQGEGDSEQSEQGEQGEQGEEAERSQQADGDADGTQEQTAAQQAQVGEAADGEGDPAAAPVLAGELGPEEAERERQQALEQWLRRVPDDPGGLLRRKFQLESRRRGDADDAQDEDSEW